MSVCIHWNFWFPFHAMHFTVGALYAEAGPSLWPPLSLGCPLMLRVFSSCMHSQLLMPQACDPPVVLHLLSRVLFSVSIHVDALPGPRAAR